MLIKYRWPGNVRELEAVVRQSLLQTTGHVVLPEFLADSVHSTNSVTAHVEHDGEPPSDLAVLVDQSLRSQSQNIYAEAVELLDRYVITRVLRHTDGNQSQAATLLGINRGSLRNKIRALGILLETKVMVESDNAP